MQLNIVYTASLDATAKVITMSVLAVSVAICYWSIRSLRKAKGDFWTVAMHVFIVFLLITINVASYLFSPKKYTVGNFDVVINRPIGDVTIHVKDISEIRGVNPGEMDGTSRTFGVGGLFGYFGNYYSKHNGDMKWYATRNDNMVLIRTMQGETIVISPDDKDFTARILAKMHDL